MTSGIVAMVLLVVYIILNELRMFFFNKAYNSLTNLSLQTSKDLRKVEDWVATLDKKED